jgi:hypothetical protein
MYFLHPDNHVELLTGRPDEPDCVDDVDRVDDVGPRCGCGCGELLHALVRLHEGEDIAW